MSQLQILYVAFGYTYLVQAINSVRTLRNSGTDASVKLITNLPVKDVYLNHTKLFDDIVRVQSDDEDNRFTKIDMFDYADGDSSLFIDCDTEVFSPLHGIVPVLRSFDLAVRSLPFTAKRTYKLLDTDSTSVPVSEFNTGVIAFSKSKASKLFFEGWRKNFLEMPFSHDQPSFLRTMFETEVRVFPLSVGWNATPWGFVDLHFVRTNKRDIRVLHYRDPDYWPEAGPNLALVHKEAVIEFSLRDDVLSREIAYFDALARHYRRWHFQYPLGRRLAAWKMKRSGSQLRIPGKRRLRESE